MQESAIMNEPLSSRKVRLDDDVSLREYLEMQVRHERELREAHQIAVTLRLEGMNELRKQIESERGVYITRTAYEMRHEDLILRISRNEQDLAAIRAARATISWIWAAMIAGGGLVIAFLTWYAMKPR